MGRKRRGTERREGRGWGNFQAQSSGSGFRNPNSALSTSRHKSSFRRISNEGNIKHHFSLNEEARNTERFHSWRPDSKLRNSRVAFISAGTSNAEDLTQAPKTVSLKVNESQDTGEFKDALKHSKSLMAEPLLETAVPVSQLSLDDTSSVSTAIESHERSVRAPSTENAPSEGVYHDQFFTDVTGSDQPVLTGFPPPDVPRSSSPSASNSSAEIILFPGRSGFHNKTKGKDETVKQSFGAPQGSSLSPQDPGVSRIRIVTEPLVPGAVHRTGVTIPGRGGDCLSIKPHGFARANGSPKLQSNIPLTRRARIKGHGPFNRVIADAEARDDYIANIGIFEGRDTTDQNISHNGHDLEHSSSDQQSDFIDISQEGLLEPSVDDWNSSDIEDFDDISTSSEGILNVDRVLSRRERLSGLQYLVVEMGSSTDDARWLPVFLLQSPRVRQKIAEFEKQYAGLQCQRGGSDNSDNSIASDQQVALDLQEDMNALEDARDLEKRREDCITDEQIARMLSKQEELGLGSGDLVLFDGEAFDTYDVQEAQLDGTFGLPSKLQPQNMPKRKTILQQDTTSEDIFVDIITQDPYNGFDIMDRERPSLRKRSKGRRGKLGLELSDSELEQNITRAWENDCTKKKIRKQEREELRAQGLLSKKGKIDVKTKYSEGMSIDQLKAEIRGFVLSSHESLPLQPMAKKERKMVHEIANVFKLKSKSVGSGKSRFPVLYRTGRTVQYERSSLDLIDAILASKHFLPRMGKTKARGPPAGKGRSGFAASGVSYRDGEMVGAAAPELGQENKGRAMLEKMGWSTGKTLGALNNTRGIVQPVAQIVKTGKAGLG